MTHSGVCSFSVAYLTRHKFTGKERDPESGLDMFGARYYGSSLGRFMTPDWAAKPIAVPYAMFGDPQSLNLYSYVRNNPLAKADADGHCPADTPNPYCNNVKVTVDKPTPEMKYDQKSVNGPVSGPGVQAKVTITDNGKGVSGVTVNEKPKSTDNLSGQPVKAPASTATTKEDGHFLDNVIAPMTNSPVTTSEQKSELTSDSLGAPYSHTVDQTLTFTTPSGAACQATYTETLQNVNPDTMKFNSTNANGVNFTFTHTDPVVSPQPQN
jgi:RHS repeat-associated protein